MTRVDAGGCGLLLGCLQTRQEGALEIELLGRESLLALIEPCVEVGVPESGMLAAAHRTPATAGQHDAFEDAAISYAVTFEVSPPSSGGAARRQAEPEVQAPSQSFWRTTDAVGRSQVVALHRPGGLRRECSPVVVPVAPCGALISSALGPCSTFVAGQAHGAADRFPSPQ